MCVKIVALVSVSQKREPSINIAQDLMSIT